MKATIVYCGYTLHAHCGLRSLRVSSPHVSALLAAVSALHGTQVRGLSLRFTVQSLVSLRGIGLWVHEWEALGLKYCSTL